MAKFQKLRSRRNKRTRPVPTATPQVQQEREETCDTSDSETEGYYVPPVQPIREVNSVDKWDVTPTPTDQVRRRHGNHRYVVHAANVAMTASKIDTTKAQVSGLYGAHGTEAESCHRPRHGGTPHGPRQATPQLLDIHGPAHTPSYCFHW